MNGNNLNEAKYINLSDVDHIPHPELFEMVGKVIKEDTWKMINDMDEPVAVRKSLYTLFGKRAIDVVVSAIALGLTIPINLTLAICTYFDVGKPIIFQQKRVGYKNKTFTITKFRNMTNEVDKNGDLLPPAQRVTKLGKFVRKTSLDELLNFWSVMKGDMSLIGPRPLLLEYLGRYSKRHRMRHAVRPGLECPMMNASGDRDSWKAQFDNDVYYVEHVSFMLDIKMAIALVKMVFDRKGTATRGSAVRGSFMGYDRDGSSIDSCMVPIRYYEEAVRRLGYNR